MCRLKIFTVRTCFSLVMSSSFAINGEAWRKSSLWTLTDTLSLQMNRRSLSLSLFRMKDRLRLMSWKCKILRLMYWKYKILRGYMANVQTVWQSEYLLTFCSTSLSTSLLSFFFMIETAVCKESMNWCWRSNFPFAFWQDFLIWNFVVFL